MYFCNRKFIVMSEDIKNTDIINDMVSEPASVAPSLNAPIAIDYGLGHKDFGFPRTIEELNKVLDEADAERNDPENWISSVEFHSRIENKYKWLR